MKIKYSMRKFTIIILGIIFFTNSLYAQLFFGSPSLGFTQACASSTFNTYNVTFTFSPVAVLSPTNQFKIELSDATGKVIYMDSKISEVTPTINLNGISPGIYLIKITNEKLILNTVIVVTHKTNKPSINSGFL